MTDPLYRSSQAISSREYDLMEPDEDEAPEPCDCRVVCSCRGREYEKD